MSKVSDEFHVAMSLQETEFAVKEAVANCGWGVKAQEPGRMCFSRQRYGKKAWEGERLPADQLEEAILDQLLAVLEREPMVREAISEPSPSLTRTSPSARQS